MLHIFVRGNIEFLCVILCRAASRLISLWPKVILEVDNERDLPIHQACRNGNKDLVAVLLQQEQSQKDIKLIQLARLSLDLKYWCVLFCISLPSLYLA